MVTNSWHILSHEHHFIHVLIHYLTTTTGVISMQLPSKLLHWCVCTQAWVRCVHSNSWYQMCTQLFNVKFWLTRIVHYSTVEETSCSIWNAYIIKFLHKCVFCRWQDNYCNPCTCLSIICKWSAVTSSHHNTMGQDYFLSFLLMYNCY